MAGPSFPLGQTLAGFHEAFIQGMQLARQANMDADRLKTTEQMREHERIRMEAERQSLADSAADRAAFGAMGGVEVPEQTIAPAVPAVPPNAGGPAIPMGGVMEAGQVETPAAPAMPPTQGAPAMPAVTERTMSVGDLSKQIGADAVGRLLQHPRGVDAMRSRGIVTDAELERRRMVAKAKQEIEVLQKEASAHADKGEAAKAYMKMAAAFERQASATDDVERGMQARVKGMEFRAQAFRVLNDEKANEDIKARSDGLKNYRAAVERKDPDAANYLIEAHLNPKSDDGRKRAHEFFDRMEKGYLTEIQDPVLTQVWKAFGAQMNAQAQAGQEWDPKTALRTALRNMDPETAARFWEKMAEGKQIPKWMQEVLMGNLEDGGWHGDDMKNAMRMARDKLGKAAPSTAVQEHARALIKDWRTRPSAGGEDPEEKRNTRKAREVQQDLKGLRERERLQERELKELRKRPSKNAKEIAEAEKKKSDIEKDIAAQEGRLRELGVRAEVPPPPTEGAVIQGTVGPGLGGPQPGPAVPAPAAPGAATPGLIESPAPARRPATSFGAPRNPADANIATAVRPATGQESEQQTRAEFYRLMALFPGRKAEVLAAMRNQGWATKRQ